MPQPPVLAGSTRPSRWGVVLGCASALFYTGANICLRRATDCDPVWVACVKAFPTVCLVLPSFAWRVRRGLSLVPSGRDLALIIAAAAVAQLLGNCLFQWSLGVVGLALAVPVTMGAVLIGSAVLGGRLLGESVTVRSWLSIGILIVAIFVLSSGAPAAFHAMHQEHVQPVQSWWIGAGVAGFVVAGFAYSILGAAIRRVAGRGMPLATILMASGLVGVLGLGILVLLRHGWDTIAGTTPSQWCWMSLAGLFNGLAFCALTAAIRSLGLLNVNALNASQTAIAALAGVLLFQEPITWALIVGVLLTVAGLMAMPRGAKPGRSHGNG